MADVVQRRVGGSLRFPNRPSIIASSTIAGPMEGKGPLARWFDCVIEDDMFGERTPEKAERRFMRDAIDVALKNAGLEPDDLHIMVAGDLLNQTVTASFTAAEVPAPFMGVYGACSTSVEGLAIVASMVDAGFADVGLSVTSSHYQAAERQFRYPIELNIQRKSTSQYTVTGAGALVVSSGRGPVVVTEATIGKVIDMGIKDPNQMGPAMAPAAADTLYRHFVDTGRTPDYYDMIITGDLGAVGSSILRDLLQRRGVVLGDVYRDSGALMFEGVPGTGVGGSGCACAALTMGGLIYKKMLANEISRALVVATGALLSSLTWQQGESIPGVAHAVALEVQPGAAT